VVKLKSNIVPNTNGSHKCGQGMGHYKAPSRLKHVIYQFHIGTTYTMRLLDEQDTVTINAAL